MMRIVLASAAALAVLSACATPRSSSDGLTWARIGETVYVDGPRVAPLALLEDSRCPKEVQCVWAGQVRVRVRITLGSGDQDRDLILGQPQPVADGALELRAVTPQLSTTAKYAPSAYRFGFKFDGGL